MYICLCICVCACVRASARKWRGVKDGGGERTESREGEVERAQEEAAGGVGGCGAQG